MRDRDFALLLVGAVVVIALLVVLGCGSADQLDVAAVTTKPVAPVPVAAPPR